MLTRMANIRFGAISFPFFAALILAAVGTAQAQAAQERVEEAAAFATTYNGGTATDIFIDAASIDLPAGLNPRTSDITITGRAGTIEPGTTITSLNGGDGLFTITNANINLSNLIIKGGPIGTAINNRVVHLTGTSGNEVSGTFTNIIFEDIETRKASPGAAEANGAVMLVEADTFNGSFDNVIFRNNYSNYKGGAIYMTGEMIGDIKNSKFLNNTSVAEGSAVVIHGLTGDIINSEFASNENSSNGALLIYGTGLTGAIRDSVFTDNIAGNGTGGAIMATAITDGVHNSLFTGNKASSGGAILTEKEFAGGITDSDFSGNISTGHSTSTVVGGGAISALAYGITGETTNNTFTNNSATDYGGAILTSKITDMSHSTFSGNSAAFGGAIAIGNSTEVPSGSALIRQSTFENNKAIGDQSGTGERGGAIYVTGGASLTLIDSNILRNTSDFFGGGIFAEGADLIIQSTKGKTSLFSGNSSYFGLNAVQTYDTSSLTLNAEEGGIIDMRDPLSFLTEYGTATVNKNGSGTLYLGGVSSHQTVGSGSTVFSINEGEVYLYGKDDVANATTADPDAKVLDGKINLPGSRDTLTLGQGTTLTAAGNNAFCAAGGTTLEDNTLIRSAEGKTDTSLEFCATTPVTVEGTTTVQVAEGQLALDGTFNGSTITKTGDGAVKLDRLNSVAGLDQFNLAAGDLTSAYDQAFKELNTGAGTAIDLGANGLTVEQGKMQGTATIESLTKNGTGTFDIDQQLTMNGALTVTDGELRVHVQEGQPSIIADSMNFGSSTQLRISGYTSGTTDRTEVDIIQTNNIIDPGELPSNIQIDGTVTQMYNFLKTDGRLSADKETLVVGLALNWYDTNQDGQQRYTDAHGNYKLDGFDFELGTQLNDRTPGLVFIKDWDGTKLTKEGDGILTLNADNTYSGGSHIMEGALRAVRSASLGIGKVDIESGARLLLDFNGIFKNDIAGGGTIESMGNVFIDDCLADFTGNIMVSSGELRLGMDGGSCDASGAIDFHVASGGRMGGLGTTGDLRVAGVIAPGHSIGTIDVNGNLAFDTGAVYEVEVDPNSNQQADLIAVTGSANLTGATVHHIGLGEVAEYGPEGEWLILTAANGLGGTRFAGPETEYLFLDQRLDYRDADTSVYLILQGNDRALDDFVLTPNQNAVANALQSMAAAPGSLYNSILALPADTDINDVYDQLSGETHSSLRGLLRDYDAGFGRAMLTRSLYPTPADCAFPLWASFGGSALHKRGNDNYAKAKLDSYDVTVGGEGRLAGGWLVGGAFRYGNSDMKVDDRHAKSDIDSYSFGVYGGKETPFFAGVLRWSTGVSYGYHDVEARRNITVPTLTQTLRADYHAQTFQAVGDLGFRFNNSAVAFFEPFVRLGWHSAWTNSFEESGGNAALRAEKEHRGNLSHHLGVRASGRLGDVVSVNASAAWIHSYGSKNNSTNFAFSQGGDTFTIDGVTVTRDAAHLTAGVGANVTEKLTLGLTYEGIVSNRFQNHGGRIFAQYCF